jgi:type III restriction enzyme
MMEETSRFFERPILNSPYQEPLRHWELGDDGQPTHKIIETRRQAKFVTPIPAPRKQEGHGVQQSLLSEEQEYDPTPVINDLRAHVDAWRRLPNSSDWSVAPETARLLEHWRHYKFNNQRPFFCQLEAVETAIWLVEVAPKRGEVGKRFIKQIEDANQEANPELLRMALKLATGAGKTTVMAMLIAWQTLNAVRRPGSPNFARGFLIVAPGLTIKERLRVLQPNDPENYYQHREIVPSDLLLEIDRAKIVITNYHAFKLRERMEVSKGTRALLEGRGGSIKTLETEGQMLQRVMPELMSMKNILVINDEAHHCYRHKVVDEENGGKKKLKLDADEKEEMRKNREAARLWISGLEIVKRKLGVSRVVDLSATPFFLAGSGYREGTLFPWTMSDFSLMDAIESGIVKLPRVPVSDNIPGEAVPRFRNLWEHIRAQMPRKGVSKAGVLDPLSIPQDLKTALDALYGHYEKTFAKWQEAGSEVPPCFIVVCNNTSSSKLVYDYISGFYRKQEDGTERLTSGRLALFRNFDEYDSKLARPRTLLIDSEQLESGEALDDNFRSAAADEIERFRREMVERSGNQIKAEDIDDVAILREAMNTVGRKGQLGESIRCIVSVSMLTEGWDANTVTHVLGVRAFGTQLLCEQVIGRALRRRSYTLNQANLFNVEYADILGIPFDFTAKPVDAPVQPPPDTVQVKAISPDRDALEIRFPRVQGYRAELPSEELEAEFTPDSILELNPQLVGPSITQNAGIIGESVNLTVEHLGDTRFSTIVMNLTKHLLFTKWRDTGEEPKLHLFPQLKRITTEWVETCLRCTGGTYPAQVLYQDLAEMACSRITDAITRKSAGRAEIKALVDPYNPVGSTIHVNFNTSRTLRWRTDPRRCHINWVILDSDWEGEFCRVAESHPQVIAYAKNHSLGFEVPYLYGSHKRQYRPDFLVLIDDGHGTDDPLHFVVEIKGYRGEDAKEKSSTMRTYWVPGVNNSGKFGRWAFQEFQSVYAIEGEFKARVEELFQQMISAVAPECTLTKS